MEVSIIATMLVVMAALSADIGIVALASHINDSACRDAARAAGQAGDSNTSLSLAQAAIRAHRTDGYYVTHPSIQTGAFVFEDYGGNPPEDASPYVTVTTASTVRLPAPIFFRGAQFGQNGSITLSRTYTFPIVKTQLYLP